MKVNIQLLEIYSPEVWNALHSWSQGVQDVWNCMSGKTFLQSEAALGCLVTGLFESQFPATLQGLGGLLAWRWGQGYKVCQEKVQRLLI